MYLGSTSFMLIILFLASTKGRDNIALNTGDSEHKNEHWTWNVSWYTSVSILTVMSSSSGSELKIKSKNIYESIDDINITFPYCVEFNFYFATVSMSQLLLTEN